MPTYVYECDSCSHTFEEFQSITAAPLKTCPTCAEPKLRRVIGPGAAVIFKGSGFYQTDYRSSSYQKAAKADAEAAKKATEPAASSSTPSESKTSTATT